MEGRFEKYQQKLSEVEIGYMKTIMCDKILSQGFCWGRKSLISLMLFLLFLCDVDVYGQSSENVTNHQLWIDIFPHFSVNDKLEYYGDAGYRTIWEESWTRIHLRPSLRYKLGKIWEIHGGLGFLYTWDTRNPNQFEIRPWQGLQLNWPKTIHMSVKNRVRIEERLVYTTDNWDFSFDLRFRYKLSLKVVPCKSCELQDVYIPIYGEMFLPVNDSIDEFFRNRGRLGIGLGYNTSKDWGFSLVMNYQKSRAGPEDEFDVIDYAYQLKIVKRWKSRLLMNERL
jgi:hypothetical protein